MRALIVGAGSVGQVFARHLAEGGATVGFLLKSAHVLAAQRGFTLYPLNRPDPTVPIDFRGFEIRTSPAEAAREALAGGWDQIYLAMSSTGLRAGTWLSELAPAAATATFVSLLPGFHDSGHLARFVDPAGTIQGRIGFASYRAPLGHETRFATPGMAYWLPPFSPCAFSGEGTRLGAVIAALRAGRLPAAPVRDVLAGTIAPSAFFMGHIAALEVAGWSFEDLADLLPLAARATREAMVVGAQELGRPTPVARTFVRPLLVALGVQLAPGFIPFDFETYVGAHFRKLADQMRLSLPLAIASGRAAGVPFDALAELSARLPPLPAARVADA